MEVIDTSVYIWMNYRKGVGLLSHSGCPALSCIIAKFKTFGNVNYDTFKKLFETGVVSVIDYCSDIWGYNDFECINNVQFQFGVIRCISSI